MLNNCLLIGVKEFFRDLSQNDFDFDLFLNKASSTDKIKYFNILKILKNYKILNFRNNPHFNSIRKYLDFFAKFYTQYFPLMEKEGKRMESIYNRNKIIRNKEENSNDKMTTIKDAIFLKVLENLISQNLNGINEELRDIVKRTVFKFSKFFEILLDKGKNIELGLFKPFIGSKDLNDVEFVSSVTTKLIKFLEEFKIGRNDGNEKEES